VNGHIVFVFTKRKSKRQTTTTTDKDAQTLLLPEPKDGQTQIQNATETQIQKTQTESTEGVVDVDKVKTTEEEEAARSKDSLSTGTLLDRREEDKTQRSDKVDKLNEQQPPQQEQQEKQSQRSENVASSASSSASSASSTYSISASSSALRTKATGSGSSSSDGTLSCFLKPHPKSTSPPRPLSAAAPSHKSTSNATSGSTSTSPQNKMYNPFAPSSSSSSSSFLSSSSSTSSASSTSTSTSTSSSLAVAATTGGSKISPTKARQLDLSFFIPGVKPPSVPVRREKEAAEAAAAAAIVERILIPKKIPNSWAKHIAPYRPPVLPPDVKGATYIETSMEHLKLSQLTSAGTFEAILMDPPWDLRPPSPKGAEEEVEGPRTAITPEELGRWRITNNLIPRGFLFIWVEKELIPRVFRMAKRWQFEYVENLVWVRKRVNNRLERKPYKYLCKSKITLLIFRKAGEIELRHQRSPDVCFDFLKKGRQKPTFVYEVIETLLPTAKYSPEEGRGKCLELWATKGKARPGWTSVVFV
jgi:N6-adenosine-specific RNA methylase IME4